MSVISLLLSKFLEARMAGADASRRRSRALVSIPSSGMKKGTGRALSLSRSFGRGCSGVRNEIYEGPLFRHLEETRRSRGGMEGRRGRKGSLDLSLSNLLISPYFGTTVGTTRLSRLRKRSRSRGAPSTSPPRRLRLLLSVPSAFGIRRAD